MQWVVCVHVHAHTWMPMVDRESGFSVSLKVMQLLYKGKPENNVCGYVHILYIHMVKIHFRKNNYYSYMYM